MNEESPLLEDDEILLFNPVGPEIGTVCEELQLKKMTGIQARILASRIAWGIMVADVESQVYRDSIFDHAISEESGSRVMARVRAIKKENLH